MNKILRSLASFTFLLCATPAIVAVFSTTCTAAQGQTKTIDQLANAFAQNILQQEEIFLSTIFATIVQEDNSFNRDINQIKQLSNLKNYAINDQLATRVQAVFVKHGYTMDKELIAARLLEAKIFESFKLFLEGKEKLPWSMVCDQLTESLNQLKEIPTRNGDKYEGLQSSLATLRACKNKKTIGNSLNQHLTLLPVSLQKQCTGWVNILRLAGLIVV